MVATEEVLEAEEAPFLARGVSVGASASLGSSRRGGVGSPW